MYGDYDPSPHQEEPENKGLLGSLSKYLPSSKILGIIVIIEILIVFGLIFFKKDDDSSSKIELENNPTYIPVSESQKINVKIDGKIYSGNFNNVVLKSDNDAIASISNDIVTTSSHPGQVTVKIIYNNNMGTGEIIVYKGDRNTEASSITTPSDNLVLKKGSTFDLFEKIIVSPSNGRIEKVEYTNSNQSVIKIDAKGKIEAIATGEAEVTIVANDKLRKRIKVKVTDLNEEEGFVGGETNGDGGEIQSISFNQPEITVSTNSAELKLKKGDAYTLIPVITPANASNKKLTYEVMDKTILSIVPSSDGTSASITALKKGTTSITVKSSNGKMAVLTVTVSATTSGGGTSSSSGCYCNSSATSCNWGSKSDDMTIKQSQIPNANACKIYPSSGGLCFKDSSGKYVFGRYGNTSGYTYAAGAQSASACDALNKSGGGNTATLSCGSALVGSTGTCNYSTNVSPYTLSSASSGDTSIATVSVSGSTVSVSCKKAGTVTITAKPSNGMSNVTSSFRCDSKEEFKVQCPSSVGIDVSIYITSPSSKIKCVSKSNDNVNISNAGDRCQVKGVKEGSVTVTVASADNSNLTKSCTISVNGDIKKDAKLSCKSNLEYNGNYQIVANCTNCNITTGSKAIGEKDKDVTQRVTATANPGHLFADGTNKAEITCTIKKQS